MLSFDFHSTTTFYKVMSSLSSTATIAFLGSARFDINEILFAFHPTYDIDNDKLLDSNELISAEYNRLAENNHVPAFITHAAFEKALTISHLNSASLARRNAFDFPTLTTDGSGLKCLRGKHRLLVAKEFLPLDDRWWILDLYTQG